MDSKQNHYEVLGIPPDTSAQDIKKAYRELAFQYHPDRNHSKQNPIHKIKMRQINEAYSILSNPIKRREYDFPQAFPMFSDPIERKEYTPPQANDIPTPKFKKGSKVRIGINSNSPYRDHTGIVDKEPHKDTFRFWYMVKLESTDLSRVIRLAEEELEEVSQ